MLEIKFSKREVTAFEAHLMRLTSLGLDPASEIDFIVRRSEEIADTDALARVLINYPFSEVRRLYNTAVEAAMPATMEALNRVAAEFEAPRAAPNPAAQADGDIDEMFIDDTIG